MSRRAPAIPRSETVCSEQTAVAGRRASPVSAVQQGQRSQMSEDKHSWDRVPAWDGDKGQWKRFLRDVELYLETEKLDVDFSHGTRLLSRLTGSARKYAETIDLDQIRRSMGADKTLVKE